MSEVDVFRSDILTVPHGFLGRGGGVSEGEMWGLNVGYGSGDDSELIAENRRRAIAAVFPEAQLATVHQVHSATVVYVEQPWRQEERPHADAMVTMRPGILLGILTADCAPVLFADEQAGVVGAAHAGWRGALAGVTDATIEAMERLGAKRERLRASVGPCIGKDSYEVDDSFRDAFCNESLINKRFFFPGNQRGKLRFDLEWYLVDRLVHARVNEIECLHRDTYADPKSFYSYRRSTHRKEASYGRQISMIGLPWRKSKPKS